MPGSRRLRGLRSLKAHGAHTPATRADGPSAGPGDSSHERGASAVATNPGTGSKPQNPSCAERRRILLPWWARPGNGLGPGPYAACEAACGSPCVDCEKGIRALACKCGRRGRGYSPSRSAQPLGATEGKEKTTTKRQALRRIEVRERYGMSASTSLGRRRQKGSFLYDYSEHVCGKSC